MTTCGPYSQATLTYDPEEVTYIPSITPNTILDFISTNHTETYKLIKGSGLEKRYNSPYPVTLFVDSSYKFDQRLSINEAIYICNMYTCPRSIDHNALKTSDMLLLKTYCPFDLMIERFGEYVNGKRMTGHIQCSNGVIHQFSDHSYK